MEFKIGDRVAAYFHGGRRVGKVAAITARYEQARTEYYLEVAITDNGDACYELTFHSKACRLLVKKKKEKATEFKVGDKVEVFVIPGNTWMRGEVCRLYWSPSTCLVNGGEIVENNELVLSINLENGFSSDANARACKKIDEKKEETQKSADNKKPKLLLPKYELTFHKKEHELLYRFIESVLRKLEDVKIQQGVMAKDNLDKKEIVEKCQIKFDILFSLVEILRESLKELQNGE